MASMTALMKQFLKLWRSLKVEEMRGVYTPRISCLFSLFKLIF
ncbi:MAG: hypothetical protein ACI9O0_001431 [Paracoccaceae bacterium]|jgi:hypothetical protein